MRFSISRRSLSLVTVMALPWVVGLSALGWMVRGDASVANVTNIKPLGVAAWVEQIPEKQSVVKPVSPMDQIAQQMEQADQQLQAGNRAQAGVTYERALALAQQVDHVALQATLHNRLGLLAASLDRTEASIEQFQAALDLGGDDRYVSNTALMGLAHNYQNMGDYAKAKGLYDRAMTGAKVVGDRDLIGQLEPRLKQVQLALKPAAKPVTKPLTKPDKPKAGVKLAAKTQIKLQDKSTKVGISVKAPAKAQAVSVQAVSVQAVSAQAVSIQAVSIQQDPLADVLTSTELLALPLDAVSDGTDAAAAEDLGAAGPVEVVDPKTDGTQL
jgi:tetratricopeptide (TPR) repeat protein